MCLMSYANIKGAHPRSLISAFVVRCLDSTGYNISRFCRVERASVAAQAGLCLAWSETPEDMFYCVVAQMKFQEIPGKILK